MNFEKFIMQQSACQEHYRCAYFIPQHSNECLSYYFSPHECRLPIDLEVLMLAKCVL